jgi:hypothetical protein
MGGCDFCYICDKRYCPKEGKSMPASRESITLSVPLHKRLKAFCIKKKIMRGEEYYKVADYNSAISFLLDAYLKRRPCKRQ